MEFNFSVGQKIHSRQTILFAVNAWKTKGFKTGFTNGCFDILHRGHCTYLEEAKKNCSRLIVGINSDASVKMLEKGSNRPINNELDRAYVIASLLNVDAVVIFDESTPFELIKEIQPDVLFKGGDYDQTITDPSNKKYIVGSDIVKAKGGTVMTIPFVDGYSTTSIIEKSKK